MVTCALADSTIGQVMYNTFMMVVILATGLAAHFLTWAVIEFCHSNYGKHKFPLRDEPEWKLVLYLLVSLAVAIRTWSKMAEWLL